MHLVGELFQVRGRKVRAPILEFQLAPGAVICEHALSLAVWAPDVEILRHVDPYRREMITFQQDAPPCER